MSVQSRNLLYEISCIKAAYSFQGMSKKLEESDKKTSTKLEVEIKNMDKKLEDLKVKKM